MNFLTIIAVAIGLAMDSFAVSIAGGVSLVKFNLRDALRTALFMGVAQAAFFGIGYALGSSVNQFIQAWDHWITLVLLSGIGLKMIFEHHEDNKFIDIKRKRILTSLAIATSIDALAVGLSFSFLSSGILKTGIVIGIVSFIFSFCGVWIGTHFSQKQKFSPYIVGGILLVGIGVKIFIEHIVNHI